MMYFWQDKDFPNFLFKVDDFINQIQAFALELGEFNGLFVNVSEQNKKEILLQIVVSEALKTSEIEGQYLSRVDVLSSLQKQLGILETPTFSKDKKAQAITELMLEVREDYQKPLTLQMLKNWHHTLMKFDKNINAGEWRKRSEPMQIISGRAGKIDIHFEAPAAKDLPKLLTDFEKWYQDFPFHDIGKVGRAMFRSALVHLYFETLHPFEDGNGRIGRALSEKALAETLEQPILISLSKKIEENKNVYYNTLKETQRKPNVAACLHYFFNLLIEAQKEVKETVLFVVEKALYFDRHKPFLNLRQLKVLQKMTEKGMTSFEGGMTAKKYQAITKTSKATATRDLQQLVERGALKTTGEGRGVNYQVNG